MTVYSLIVPFLCYVFSQRSSNLCTITTVAKSRSRQPLASRSILRRSGWPPSRFYSERWNPDTHAGSSFFRFSHENRTPPNFTKSLLVPKEKHNRRRLGRPSQLTDMNGAGVAIATLCVCPFRTTESRPMTPRSWSFSVHQPLRKANEILLRLFPC